MDIQHFNVVGWATERNNIFIYLFAHKSTIITAIKYMKQGRTARLTRALTAALKTTNSNVSASSEF